MRSFLSVLGVLLLMKDIEELVICVFQRIMFENGILNDFMLCIHC